ncbi:hypothetical protein [uncultured Enorma sp.]|nr:hypothetical protein [uncultured Enorma sp.]
MITLTRRFSRKNASLSQIAPFYGNLSALARRDLAQERRRQAAIAHI